MHRRSASRSTTFISTCRAMAEIGPRSSKISQSRSKAMSTQHSAAVTDLALHRELRRLGLITRDDHLVGDQTTRMIAAIDAFNTPFLRSLNTFLPPRSAAAKRATRGR